MQFRPDVFRFLLYVSKFPDWRHPGCFSRFFRPPPATSYACAVANTIVHLHVVRQGIKQHYSHVLYARHRFCWSPHLNEFSSTLESNMNSFFHVVALPCFPFPSVLWASFWYSMLQVMTGPRREASGLLTIAKSDYGNPKTMRFLSPYAGGDDILIVEETPGRRCARRRCRARRIFRRDKLISAQHPHGPRIC